MNDHLPAIVTQRQHQQAQQKPASGGLKYDADKPRMDLLDPYAMEGLAAVLTFGSRKYASWNWLKGISYSRLLAAMQRHLSAIQKGEYLDPESGLPHIDHAGACWMFLSGQMKRGDKMDDLPHGPNGEFK
jgi:hypothetical protein